MSEYDNLANKANEIVIGILESIVASTDNNNDNNDDSYYIVEEADDYDDDYIVEEYEDANNDINNDINSDTSTNTILVHIDRCAKLKKGCRVQQKSSSLYNEHGDGTIISSKSNDSSDTMYLINFDKVASDTYWYASDLMLVINGLVITECNVNINSNSISYSGKWQEYDSHSYSTRNDKVTSNSSTPDKKGSSSNSNKSNSPSKNKAPNRLYDDADRLRNKRLLAMHNSIQEFSKNATFTPKIPLSSQQLALQKEGYQNISDKLYSDTLYAKKFDRKEKLSSEKRKEETFSPKLSPRSKELARSHKVSSTEVHNRLFNEASLKREQLLKKEEEKIQEEMKDITFSPTISKLASSKSSPSDQDPDTAKRLYNYAGMHHAKRASLVQSYIQEEMKEATFVPIINYQSSPTDTGVDVATRLHEDVHRRRASLMKKRESIIQDQMKEATFTPEISELSNNLAAMRSVSPTSVLSADAAASRLYEDAVRKKDRAQFLEELQAEEIRATSFTPKKYTAENNVRSKVFQKDSKNSSPNSKNVSSNSSPTKSNPKVVRKSPKSVNMNDFVDVNEPTEF